MKLLTLFFMPGTRRRAAVAAREELLPDLEMGRPGEKETGLTAQRAKGRGRRARIRQRNVVAAFGRRSLRQRNVAAAFSLGSLRMRNVAATFGLGSLRRRNVAAAFGRRSLRERNRIIRFGFRSLRERNRIIRFGLRSLRARNVEAFWHFRGRLASNGMRGGCRGS